MAVDPRTAGQFRERVRFEQRALDANGDRLGPWTPLWICRARIESLAGSEPVMSARLQGDDPTRITIRDCSEARAIDNACRVVDANNPKRIWDVKSDVRDERHVWIAYTCVRYAGQIEEA